MTIKIALGFLAIFMFPAWALAADEKPQLPQGAAISMDLPTSVRLRVDERIPLVITSKGAAATGVSVAAGPFVDSTSSNPLQIEFCLAEDVSGNCPHRFHWEPILHERFGLLPAAPPKLAAIQELSAYWQRAASKPADR